jgi:hypothetical protein
MKEWTEGGTQKCKEMKEWTERRSREEVRSINSNIFVVLSKQTMENSYFNQKPYH